MKKNSHGADLYDLEARHHLRPEEIRDFSSNVNPLGPSKKALAYVQEHLDMVSRYPDPEYRKLKGAISDYIHTDPEAIVLGNGTTELLQTAIRTLRPARALLNLPCYSEYARELSAIGAEIVSYPLDYKAHFKIDVDRVIATIRKEKIDLYILTNPNNPTGSILTRAEIEHILDSTETTLLIDETYIEFTDCGVYSAASLAATRDDLLVLRGTSKFFATPGIRLGYGITANNSLKESLAETLPMWGINSVAEGMGQLMFSDEDFKLETFHLIWKEKERICTGLESIPALKVFPSYANFVLVKIKDRSHTAEELRSHLLQKKMVIRDCASFDHLDERFFRFCILDPASNDELLAEIKNFFEQAPPKKA